MKTHLQIKQKREQSGLTQSEIADKLNMSLSGYQKYESGMHDIRAEKFIEIINILDFSRSERIEILGKRVHEKTGE